MKKNALLFGVLILAAVLRLMFINQSLWLDEAIGALAARDYSFEFIAAEFVKFDNHPPLYYLVLKGWGEIFGFSDISLRLPSVIFGLLTIYYLFKIEIIAGGKRTQGIIAALILATSQIHVYYSQEIRMYSLSTFLVTICIYYFLKTIRKRNLLDWLTFSVLVVFLAFSDYLPVFVFPAMFVYALINVKSWSWWKKFILCFLPLGVVFFIWLPFFQIQSEKGKWLLETVPNWRFTSGGAEFKQIALMWMKYVSGRVTLPDKNLYYFLVVIFSVPFAVAFTGIFKKRSINNIYFYWFFIPTLGSLLISFIIPAFNYFRMIFVLPAFYGLLVTGLNNIGNKRLKNILLSLILLTNFFSLSIYYLDDKNHREDWSGAVNFINTMSDKSEAVLFSYPEPFAPYRWYLGSGNGATDSILASDKSITITRNLILNKNGVYYFEYLSALSDPHGYVKASIESSDFKLNKIYNFNGVGLVYHYTK